MKIEDAALICRYEDLDQRNSIKLSTGYVVDKDGNVYSLLKRFTHGLILALLYPEVFKAYQDTLSETERFDIPDHLELTPVFKFQNFELEVHGELDVIRISATRMSGNPSLDKPRRKACSPEQIKAVIKICAAEGWSASNTIITTDTRDMRFYKMLDFLATDTDPYTEGFDTGIKDDHDDEI